MYISIIVYIYTCRQKNGEREKLKDRQADRSLGAMENWAHTLHTNTMRVSSLAS